MLALSVLAGCNSDYRPTLCTAVNFGVLDCIPTDQSKPRYDLKTNSVEFLGMSCMSSEDFKEGKKRARKIIEGLN